ncbi:papain-like cysteine protease family protein [Streptomyces coelicoflavus]|uniref:papain-like cysteine protease family protein n=1 Tax=Streptomyces coelicoflavus TaxID=285562 RepID=UPI000D5988B5|nr:papain-like cysteine protease family protein [Streptomyces coelicoflavus]
MRLSPSPRTRRRWAVALALSASLGLFAPSTASAATTGSAVGGGTTAAESSGGTTRAEWSGSTAQAEWTWRRLNISMQAQQMSNWCWAAAGDTVAEYYGRDYSQNQFCNLAFGRAVNGSCPNWQATLGNDQRAFDSMGINPGRYVDGYLNYDTLTREIDADRPVMSRIQWQSGGGHMLTVYGYDVSRNWVYWGDPWPSSNRYNWATYSYYVNNGSFFWTHSLYGIGA